MELLAILGRGIQRECEDGSWVLTEDLEMCDEKGAHLSVRVPPDDDNPHCLIGGGKMNVEAGSIFIRNKSKPKLTVCAWGMRSPYLISVDGPTESEVMTDYLRSSLVKPDSFSRFEVWPRQRTTPPPSNTNRELQNIFELAVERGFTKVGIVTVQVHYARTLLMAQRHLVKPEFAHLKLQFYASEAVLLAKNSYVSYGPRVRRMYGSRAFMRTMFYEQRGINALLAGNY